ncbi:YbgC/FadM family acyl-CoA thioesterase [Aristophania vespae]|uniref:YbgC/FadM family acyl-CoA thioesterase n=1 Tax=Aristophania vespae TaxID=2697033 RepID=A0A6P1NHW3_9PROT|nr:YbgC/FadM family acyl-CoA thioesterase [Aristophania vespae]QHI95242.1 YbgC/FadM family acyl-CoA thioesterase [Aristophania vespae]
MAHHIKFRVYYEDTDAGGIVYHARYLGFAERARAEALRELGLAIGELAEKENLGFVVANLSIHYHRPAKLDDVLEIETCLVEAKAARFILQQNIFTEVNSEKLHIASLKVELVSMAMDRLKPVRLPVEVKKRLEQLRTDN